MGQLWAYDDMLFFSEDKHLGMPLMNWCKHKCYILYTSMDMRTYIQVDKCREHQTSKVGANKSRLALQRSALATRPPRIGNYAPMVLVHPNKLPMSTSFSGPPPLRSCSSSSQSTGLCRLVSLSSLTPSHVHFLSLSSAKQCSLQVAIMQ